MTDQILTTPEWEKAMEILMDLCTEVPVGGSFTTRPAYTPKMGPTLMEVPSTGPDGSTLAPIKPSGHVTEVPPTGGFISREAYTPNMGPTMKEIPNNHPAEKGPRTALEWALLLASLNMKTDSNWQTREALSPKIKGINFDANAPWTVHKGPDHSVSPSPDKHEVHDAVLDPDPGIPGMENLPGGPGHIEGPDSARSLRGIHTTLLVQDDGSHGADLAMQDGSFFILNLGDLRAKIDQVQSMDDVSLDPKGHYQAIKNHIIKRAAAMNMQHIVPANWQLSMAGLEAADADAKKKNLPPWLKKKGDDKGDDDKDDKGGKGDDDKDDKKKPAKKSS